MKDPDRLPHVLLALLDQPALPRLLNNPPVLVNYLRQGWREEQEDDWNSMAPDSQEASEEAEIDYLLEMKLGSMVLTTPQRAAIYQAVESVCPEAIPHLSLRLSRKEPVQESWNNYDDPPQETLDEILSRMA